MTLTVLGCEVCFSLETASDYVKDNKACLYGFRCTVVGYEWPSSCEQVNELWYMPFDRFVVLWWYSLCDFRFVCSMLTDFEIVSHNTILYENLHQYNSGTVTVKRRYFKKVFKKNLFVVFLFKIVCSFIIKGQLTAEFNFISSTSKFIEHHSYSSALGHPYKLKV